MCISHLIFFAEVGDLCCFRSVLVLVGSFANMQTTPLRPHEALNVLKLDGIKNYAAMSV